MMTERQTVLKRRAGEILHCIHSAKVAKGCGKSQSCKNCIIRNSVKKALRGQRIVRLRTRIKIIQHEKRVDIYALVTVSPFSFRGDPHALLVIEDLSEVAELYRMILICPVCGKMQDEEKSWMRVEAYFKNNWDVDCSHGYCPDCFKVEMEKIKASEKNELGSTAWIK
jgi:hypothetical protein